MRGLQCLDIAATRVTTSALADLRDLPMLRCLWISGVEVDDGWEGLRDLRSLSDLVVYRAAPAANDWSRLAELPQLRSIWCVEAAEVDPQTLEVFEQKNPLCRLVVGSRPAQVIGKDHQRALAERLQERGAKVKLAFLPDTSRESEDVRSDNGPVVLLDITLPAGCALADDDVRLLSCLTGIRAFSAPGMADADRCAAALDEQASTAKQIDLSKSDLTDAGLARLASLPQLEILYIAWTKVTDAGMKHLARARRLRHLDLFATPIGDESLKRLAQLPDLESLKLGYSDVSERGLRNVLALRTLRGLDLDNLPVTDELVRQICEMPQLAHLGLRGERLRLSSAVVSSLARLQKVEISFAPLVTDDWVEPLGKLTALSELKLWGTKITSAGIEKLHAALPRCRIFSDHGTIEPERPTERK
jgi:hypothetical protein